MKTLVAGFGNVFFHDDAYGTEAARLLATQALPRDVRVADFGIRGLHAAFEMLEDYDLVILLDAAPRNSPPGTLHVIDPESVRGSAPPDAHSMELHNALAFYERLARDLNPHKRPRIVIIGCEPERVDEGIGLSPAVAAAVPATLPLVRRILTQTPNRSATL